VNEVLEYWESRLVFTQSFVDNLRSLLTNSSKTAGTKRKDSPHVAIVGSQQQTITSLSASTISDSERQRLREIERKVAEYARQLNAEAQSASTLDGRRRLTSAQINEKVMAYRTQLVNHTNTGPSL
jgi:translation initiation factor 2 beta subunit (eIF-2beta)/eIF-5